MKDNLDINSAVGPASEIPRSVMLVGELNRLDFREHSCC